MSCILGLFLAKSESVVTLVEGVHPRNVAIALLAIVWGELYDRLVTITE